MADEIKEGGQLMDPAGKEFQDMLAAAQTAAVEKLAIKPDTSPALDGQAGQPKDEKDAKDKSVSSTESKDEPDDKEKADKLEEEPGDDIGNLKHKVAGLQAELTRVRKQKTGSADEVASLRERIADTEGQLKVLREGSSKATVADKLAKLTDDQVSENKIAWEDELTDARVTARLAEKENDVEQVREANSRISAARKALGLYSAEEKRRVSADAKGKSSVEEERPALSAEVENLFTDLNKVAPDLQDKESDLWKAAQKEYAALPKLMKALGPMGELIAASAAIAKNPKLIGKKVISGETSKVLDAIESAADKSFNKGGAAPKAGQFTPITTINSQADLISFEEQVRKVKGG